MRDLSERAVTDSRTWCRCAASRRTDAPRSATSHPDLLDWTTRVARRHLGTDGVIVRISVDRTIARAEIAAGA